MQDVQSIMSLVFTVFRLKIELHLTKLPNMQLSITNYEQIVKYPIATMGWLLYLINDLCAKKFRKVGHLSWKCEHPS